MTFDAREPGTPAGRWLADDRLAALPALGPPGGGVVVLAAHPDDETLGAGTLIAELDLRGRPPLVVVVTDGAGAGADPDLARRRAVELREALALLAPGVELVTLGVADGGLREARDDVALRLEELLRQRAAAGSPLSTLVSTWRGDGHRDHRVLGEIATDAARRHGAALWEYPIWLWHWAGPDHADVPWTALRRLPGSGEASARRARALDAYASQIAGPAAVVPHDVRRVTGRGEDSFVVTDAVATHDDGDHDGSGSGSGSSSSGSDVPAAFFDDTYARHEDPWGFTSRWYERRKRALTLAALPRDRFTRAWEVGCSIGVLTAELAPRCDALVAVDVAPAAIARARVRLADHLDRPRAGAHPALEVAVMDVTREAPPGTFDLVVLSEVLYYLSPPTLRAFLARLLPLLTDDAVVLACHWRHPVPGYALGGDEVHHELAVGLAAGASPVIRTGRYEDEDLLLEVFTRDGRSVAARSGLL